MIVRDEQEIARNSIRIPHADVPIASHSGVGPNDGPAGPMAFLVGSCAYFSSNELRSRYSDADGYRRRLEESARAAVAAGALLEHDVDAVVAEARDALLANVGGSTQG